MLIINKGAAYYLNFQDASYNLQGIVLKLLLFQDVPAMQRMMDTGLFRNNKECHD